MNITIYIENDVYPLDFAIPYEYFSRVGAEVSLVAEQSGLLTTATGLQLHIDRAYDSITQTDVLWVCGGMNRSDVDPSILAWLQSLVAGAQCVVAVTSGVDALVQSGALENHAIALGKLAKKRYRKLPLQVEDKPIVCDGKWWTVSAHGDVRAACFMLIKQLFDDACYDALLAREGITDFVPVEQTARDWRKFSSENAKQLARYHKQLVGAKRAESAVLYAYSGMSALDYLTIDTLLSHLPYQRHHIADQRGKISCDHNGYQIVIDQAIQNQRQSRLLFVPGGAVEPLLVNPYLKPWLQAICSQSYRILAIGSAEQLLAVCGLIKDIDRDVLYAEDFTNSRYMISQHLSQAVNGIIATTRQKDKRLAKHIERFFVRGATHIVE